MGTGRADASSGGTVFDGEFDAVQTYARLRRAGVLGAHSYLHVMGDHAEIGWAPVEHFRFRPTIAAAGVEPGWHVGLRAFADAAATLQRKAVGYVAFDLAPPSLRSLVDDADTGAPQGAPLAEFIIPGEVIVFERSRARSLSNTSLSIVPYLAQRTASSLSGSPSVHGSVEPMTLQPIAASAKVDGNVYRSAVAEARDGLRRGDAERVVLSRYRAYEADYDPLRLFEAYALPIRPADAYLLEFSDVTAIVASPEVLLECRAGNLSSNPLVGTRPRGATPEDEARLRSELLHDRKEIVEHVLCVTTIHKEFERVCDAGTATISRLLDVIRHGRVQHLSSVLTGRLGANSHAADALAALFPAVTLTGVPKDKALPLIRRLEGRPRGLYTGTVGWISGREDGRFSLIIRSILKYGARSFIHAGAGIMPESCPEAEYEETATKLAAMEEALASAAAGAHATPHRRAEDSA